MTANKQILLLVLDGWGYRENTQNNAIAEANPEFMNAAWKNYPHALLDASGEAVGLPKGTIGTSEIGHLTIGSGRIIYTDLVKVFKAIEENTLKDNQTFNEIVNHVKTNNSTLHFMGLLSPAGVHTHQDHLFALIKQARQKGITNIVIHVFTDGRDTPPKSASRFISDLHTVLNEVGTGHVATIMGRYYAMDRDKNWDRTQKAYDALFNGIGEQHSGEAAEQIVKEQYEKGTSDEFITPQILTNAEGKPDVIKQNDGVFFFNFRPDRARQLSKLILDKQKDLNLYFATLTEYDKTLPTQVAFPQSEINETLSDILAEHGLTQAHIAETEKYAHVTYFFNGGKEIKHDKEEYILVDSRKDIPTHDLAPEMKAKEVADKTIEYIEKGTDFIVTNFANADMIGHTGKWEPTIRGVKFEDEQIKRVTEAMLAKGGTVLITADHGNAEIMRDEEGNPKTAHTLEPVPFIITVNDASIKSHGGLADVAPTVLKLFGLSKPAAMTGESLI